VNKFVLRILFLNQIIKIKVNEPLYLRIIVIIIQATLVCIVLIPNRTNENSSMRYGRCGSAYDTLNEWLNDNIQNYLDGIDTEGRAGLHRIN
jgi:hypothetical protein